MQVILSGMSNETLTVNTEQKPISSPVQTDCWALQCAFKAREPARSDCVCVHVNPGMCNIVHLGLICGHLDNNMQESVIKSEI